MTLREIMTEQIKRCFWLDYNFKPEPIKDYASFDPATNYLAFTEYTKQLHDRNNANYLAFLNAQNDEDFLESYNRVRQAEMELD